MTLPWKLSVTASGLTSADLERAPSLFREAGIDRIEGGWRFHPEPNLKAFAATGKRFKEAGIRLDSFHLPFGPAYDLSHFYETHRGRAVSELCDWITAVSAAGAPLCIIHPGAIDADVQLEGLDRFLDAICRSLETLADAAAANQIQLAVENLPPRPDSERFGALPEHFSALSQRFQHPNVGFCLDTGHAHMMVGAERIAGMFDAMGERLIAFHLADNAGDRDAHLAPGRGLVDWDLVFTRAHQLGFTGTMCIETPPFAPGPHYTPQAWRQLVDDTAQLAGECLASTP